jgi:hypothetical protein
MTDTDRPPRWQEYLSLDELLERRDPRNPKDHADRDIRKSMGRFGYTEPVMVDERTGFLVAGHGRVDNLAARRAAGENPPDGIVDHPERGWTVPTNRGWASRSDEEAAAYLVAANQLTIKGGWKPDPFAAILAELRSTDTGLEGIGLSPTEAADILAAYGPVPTLDELADQIGDPEPEDFWPVLRLKVSPETKAEFERWLDTTGQVTAGDDAVMAGLLRIATAALADAETS